MRTGLTRRQLEGIEVMCEHPDWSYTKVADELGVHRNSIVKWMKNPVYRQKMEEYLHALFKDSAKYAVNTMIALSKRGDRQASQFILENTGFKAADKVEIGTTDIKINIGQ